MAGPKLVEYGWALKAILAKSYNLGCALDQRIEMTPKVPGHDVITAIHCHALPGKPNNFGWALMSLMDFGLV